MDNSDNKNKSENTAANVIETNCRKRTRTQNTKGYGKTDKILSCDSLRFVLLGKLSMMKWIQHWWSYSAVSPLVFYQCTMLIAPCWNYRETNQIYFEKICHQIKFSCIVSLIFYLKEPCKKISLLLFLVLKNKKYTSKQKIVNKILQNSWIKT